MTETKSNRQLLQMPDNPLQEVHLNLSAGTGGPVTYSVTKDVYQFLVRGEYHRREVTPNGRLVAMITQKKPDELPPGVQPVVHGIQ